ncbi:hypothetical protein DL89DRAFT_5179 [Linderina pennispora]|uniref:Uncharacterized protein n=1 Tax=Linderina pennispora TaxID=61395 RepID=A0A1Y1WKM2_9FUNG|nr:uncharacterized protein DL89DRAFT_5179 [Linderina pennispora]ORX73868.1 hypothetical protein DL89DRAFT_5179 [Linderina pennispora]
MYHRSPAAGPSCEALAAGMMSAAADPCHRRPRRCPWPVAERSCCGDGGGFPSAATPPPCLLPAEPQAPLVASAPAPAARRVGLALHLAHLSAATGPLYHPHGSGSCGTRERTP